MVYNQQPPSHHPHLPPISIKFPGSYHLLLFVFFSFSSFANFLVSGPASSFMGLFSTESTSYTVNINVKHNVPECSDIIKYDKIKGKLLFNIHII